jgi:hypothetical protein
LVKNNYKFSVLFKYNSLLLPSKNKGHGKSM